MGIVYGDDSWFVEGCSDFDDDIGFEKVKVQLTLSTHIKGESPYLAFYFSTLGSLAIIFGASSSKLNEVIPGFQFAGELAEIIAAG